MPYIEDENGNHILDENGNKIEFTVESIDTPNDWKFVYKESIHVNDDGHLDTENRHLVIKNGVNSNHAISLQQLINSNEDIIKPYVGTKIQQSMLQLDDDFKGLLDSTIKKTIYPKVDEKIDTAITVFANKLKQDAANDDPMDAIMAAVETRIATLLNAFKAELVEGVNEYLNNQVAMRIGRKSGTIPKTNYQWIKLLSKGDIEGINTLQEIIVTNTYIRRNDRYHHSKSDLVASSFHQLEFFFDVSFENYYCYFNSHPSDWTMEYFVEYIRIQLPDNNEEEEEEE